MAIYSAYHQDCMYPVGRSDKKLGPKFEDIDSLGIVDEVTRLQSSRLR